jgi:predicted permease
MPAVRLAARSLLRAPAFSLTVVASLAVSIAAIATVFSVADAVLFRALPFRNAGRLVSIGSVRPQRSDAPFTLAEFMDYSARARTVDIAAFTSWNAAMATPTVARRLQGMRISANAFEVLGVSPTIGRLLRPADDATDAPRVVLLGHAFWKDQFAEDRGIIGRVVRLNGEQYAIVGVLPPHFPLPLRSVDVIVPLTPDRDPRRHIRTSTNFLRLFGRIRDGSSVAVAAGDLAGIAASLRAEWPDAYASKLGVAVTAMQESLVGGTRQTFVVMLGAAALLLAIALTNVLNLLLIRGVARRGEMAVRRALGGSTRQLASGAVSEAALLAFAGAIVGSMLARWVVSLVASSSIAVLRLDEAGLDWRTLALVVVIAVVATLLFSVIQIASALRSTPRQALAAVGRGLHGSRDEARLRSAFLIAQLGFAVLLTIVTATMARSLARLQAVDLGFRPDSVFVARVSLPPQKYSSVADLNRFARDFERELRGMPGVSAAGAISIAPLSGNLATIPFRVVGRTPAAAHDDLTANFRAITPGYLAAVGASLVRGRDFGLADDEAAPRVVIVSRALADTHLNGRDPLGRELLINDNNRGPRPVTIVGVVENMRHVTVDGPAPFDIYLPMAQVHPDGLGLVAGSQFWTLRLASPSPAYARTFARTLERIDRDVAVGRVQSMRSYVDDHLSPRRFTVMALLGFALVALVLATIGVYGVVAYSVAQRRREIGLRLALGATGATVVSAFMRPTLVLTMIGVAIGSAGAALARNVVAELLFGVTATDPVIFGTVAALLILTSAVAAAVPARRASRIDPSIALAEE